MLLLKARPRTGPKPFFGDAPNLPATHKFSSVPSLFSGSRQTESLRSFGTSVNGSITGACFQQLPVAWCPDGTTAASIPHSGIGKAHQGCFVVHLQGEPENPKDKPDTRKPIFNVRWMLRVHFVIWVTISTWEPKRTSNGTATSLPPSPVSDCHAYNSSAFFSCQTDTTHQKTGKTLKSGVASFLPKKWDSTFTSVLVLASQQFKHLKCS